MRRLPLLLLTLLISAAPVFAQAWKPLANGAEYREFSPTPPFVYHVTRIDLESDDVELFVTAESDRGERVTDVAERHDALAAINGDYFDEKLRPTGVTLGPCGKWKTRAAPSRRKAAVVAIGDDRAALVEGSSKLPAWARTAVSGWPTLVRNCRALSSRQLPGSDRFTRAPHYRTAVGMNADGTTVYLVVATGQKGGSAGVTLPTLASFMRETLGVCSAVNLDGGGSAVMSVAGKLVAAPSYGEERRVANHLLLVRSEDYPACGDGKPVRSVAIRATDRQIWEDIAEVLDRKGSVQPSGIYRIPLGRIGVGSESWVAFKRTGDDITMSGVMRVDATRASEVERMLRRDGIDIIAAVPLARTSITEMRFGGSGSPARLAAIVRNAIERAHPH